ncbi:MAG: alpha-L-fucosidase [Bacteroidales bacterium]|nr:alpha-L-fucosidase [Bacteroidales bacterium]
MRRLTKALIGCALSGALATSAVAQEGYQPTPENIEARRQFSDNKFGIFLHWGIYSLFGQGEWYLQSNHIHKDEYAKAAGGFYPARFDAAQWVAAFKKAGAKYICFTTRHHDGFSMFDTKYSDYDIIDATPFKRDIVGELTAECKKQGLKVHFYYSHIDWTREDYPMGYSGRNTGKDPKKADWKSYYAFMNHQLEELIRNYDPDAIWFDGVWDHNPKTTDFDWQLEEQYAFLHRLKPSILVGNNHHLAPYPGEDFQMFERDLPGENKAGFSEGTEVSRLPLETCETMNGMWGYKIIDQNYKSVRDLVRLLVGAAGKGANLLLNIGPQPDGELPATALERLDGMGAWLAKFGETVYGTTAGDVPTRPWGVTTRKGDKLYVHIFSLDDEQLFLPLTGKVKSAVVFEDRQPVKFRQTREGVLLGVGQRPDVADYVLELTVAD